LEGRPPFCRDGMGFFSSGIAVTYATDAPAHRRSGANGRKNHARRQTKDTRFAERTPVCATMTKKALHPIGWVKTKWKGSDGFHWDPIRKVRRLLHEPMGRCMKWVAGTRAFGTPNVLSCLLDHQGCETCSAHDFPVPPLTPSPARWPPPDGRTSPPAPRIPGQGDTPGGLPFGRRR